MSSVLLKVFLDYNDNHLGDITVSPDDLTNELYPKIIGLSSMKGFHEKPSLLFSKFTATHKQRSDGLVVKMIPFGPYFKVISSDSMTIGEVLGKLPSGWNPSQRQYEGFFDLTPIDWIKVSIY